MVATLRTRGLATAANAALTPGQTRVHVGFELQTSVGDHRPDREVPGSLQPAQLAHVLQRDPVVALDQALADQDAEEGPASDDRGLGVLGAQAQRPRRRSSACARS